MKATTIDEVIEFLDNIIDNRRAEDSKLAYFPVLYRKVTIAVKQGIAKEEFDDNPRMERLDVIFANRYLEAYSQFEMGKPLTASWQVAFDAATDFWPLILQHLLLGINAHINLDLGIAAAECAPGNELASLKSDFDRINAILAGMVEGVQADINKVSPLIGLLDSVAGKLDERLVDFSIRIARDGAWEFAGKLAVADADERRALIAQRDASIAWLGRDIRRPGIFLGSVAAMIRLFEWAPVGQVIEVLES